MVLNGFGNVVRACWDDLPNHYHNVELDTFVIMPNHLHGIIGLIQTVRPESVGAGFKPAPTKQHGLPEIVRALKTFSARRINAIPRAPGHSMWQRNCYERVIRDEDELNRIREYIVYNPAKWADDKDNPENWK